MMLEQPLSILAGTIISKMVIRWFTKLKTVCDKEDQVQSIQSIPDNEFNQLVLMQMKNLIENY